MNLAQRLTETLLYSYRGLARIEKSRTLFDGFCYQQGSDPNIALDKLVAETAILLLIARRHLKAKTIEPLVLQVSRLSREKRHYDLIGMYPETAAGLALAHTALSRFGKPDERFHQILEKALAHPSTIDYQRPTFREMEQRWIRMIASATGPIESTDLLASSVCTSMHSVLDWDNAKTYAFTHEVFYLTDFGRFRLPDVFDMAEMASAIDDALIVQIAYNNFDLMAELLIVRTIIKASSSPVLIFAHCLLVKTWQKFSFLPSPHFKELYFDSLSNDMKSFYGFFGTYHTTYVGALYLSQLLANGQTESMSCDDYSAYGQEIDWIPDLRQGDAPIFAGVVAALGEAVLPVLADAAVIRARSFGTEDALEKALLRRERLGGYSRRISRQAPSTKTVGTDTAPLL